eukprot:COSAG04_NODE_9571_length_851_cov_0.929521_2_plen_65_part_01
MVITHRYVSIGVADGASSEGRRGGCLDLRRDSRLRRKRNRLDAAEEGPVMKAVHDAVDSLIRDRE